MGAGKGWSPPEVGGHGHHAAGVGQDGDRDRRGRPSVTSGMAVGQMLASLRCLLDLDVVAIGGGLINAGPLLMEPRGGLRTALQAWVRERLEIVAASAGQNAGILGAAALVAGGDKYWTPPLESAAT